MHTLRQIANHYRKKYKLDFILIFPTRQWQKEHMPIRTQGRFYANTKLQVPVIMLRHKRMTPANIGTLLHEIGHVIQHKQKRLVTQKNHHRLIYANEIEAEVFSRAEYNKHFRHHGKLPHWGLASYGYYRTRQESAMDWELDDFIKFIRNLPVKQYRHIRKHLNKHRPRDIWEKMFLKMVEV